MTTHQAPTPSQEMIDEIRETCKRQIEDKQRELNKANRETRRLRQQLEHTAEELDEVNQDLRRVQADSGKANSKASKDLADSLQQEKSDKEHAIADRDHAMEKIARLEMRNSELQRYRRSDWQVIDQFLKAIEDPIRELRRYNNSLQESGYSEEGPGAAQLPGNTCSSKYLPNWPNAIKQNAPLPIRQDSVQSSPVQLNDHQAGPAVSSSRHNSEDGSIEADSLAGQGIGSIIRGISRDSSHLNEPHGTGTVYWFRDVVHGAMHGQTNHASADAVRDEVECFLNAGIRPDQITVVAWSPGQTGLIKGKLRLINPLSGRADDVLVVFVEDFGDGESDVIIADLVMADERTHHSNYVSQEGDSKSYKARKTRKTLMARAKDSINLEIGFAQATHGFVMIGQSNWLIRWPKFEGLIDKHPHAEIVRDAWRRKVYIRDTTHRDTHPNVVQKLRDLGSAEVSRRAAVADAAHLEFFERLINAGPKISRISRPKEDKQAIALQRAQADEDQARLQHRAAKRQQTEEDLWQEAHEEEDS